jgi:hypothetical protein
VQQRRASAETIAGYRDCFRLFLRFAAQRLRKSPSNLSLDDLNAPFIGEFLDHLESERSNGARTRNTRLAAIHSFFRYVSFQEPSCAELCQRVLVRVQGNSEVGSCAIRGLGQGLRVPVRPLGRSGGCVDLGRKWRRVRLGEGRCRAAACAACCPTLGGP